MTDNDPTENLKEMETEIAVLKKAKDAFEEENIKLKKKDAEEDKYAKLAKFMQETFRGALMLFPFFLNHLSQHWTPVTKMKKRKIHMMNLWRKAKTATGKPLMVILCANIFTWPFPTVQRNSYWYRHSRNTEKM